MPNQDMSRDEITERLHHLWTRLWQQHGASGGKGEHDKDAEAVHQAIQMLEVMHRDG